jgi:hypothetical protein
MKVSEGVSPVKAATDFYVQWLARLAFACIIIHDRAIILMVVRSTWSYNGR